MRATEKFPRSTLSTDAVKRMIDRAAELGFAAVSFTGGEPFLYLDELATLADHAGKAGIPYIRTGTNGFAFARAAGPRFRDRVRRIAEKLAATPLRNLWISLDSADAETHERMRGLPGVVDAIERALPIFQECGVYPSANLGINRNVGGRATAHLKVRDDRGEGVEPDEFEEQYRAAFRSFYRAAIDLGFTIVNACYPMSVGDEPGAADPRVDSTGNLNAVYAATSDDDVVRYTAAEKGCLFKALSDAVAEFRHRVRIFSPRCSLHALWKQYSQGIDAAYPCRGGIDFVVVDCRDGNTYPCGYRGAGNLGEFWSLDPRSLPRQAACRRCDWECFRDPSELAGPLLEGLSNPLGAWKRMRSDRQYFALWLEDWRYYRACDFFDGRRPPRPRRLARFRRLPQTPRRESAAHECELPANQREAASYERPHLPHEPEARTRGLSCATHDDAPPDQPSTAHLR